MCLFSDFWGSQRLGYVRNPHSLKEGTETLCRDDIGGFTWKPRSSLSKEKTPIKLASGFCIPEPLPVTASGLSYLLLQLVVTAGKRVFQRRALRRPHPARREVTCGDTDMDWPRLGAVLHTTGLWGRSYLGVGRRPASRTWQKVCQREDTGLPWGKPYCGRIHIWDYPKENQAIRTPSPVQGLTGDPGELTPVLGLASDCSAQSDCRGCLEDSTRVHHPGNWTGREKGARIPGWGGMAQQAWHRPVLPAHYLFPNTREETGSTQRLYNLAKVFRVAQPAALQMSAKEAPCANAWEEATLLVEWALTPRGHGSPPLSSGPTSVWRQPSLSAALRGRQRAAQSFWRSGCGPRICAMLLRDTATLRLDLPPPRAVLAGSPPDRGVVGTLGTYPGRGLKTMWE